MSRRVQVYGFARWAKELSAIAATKNIPIKLDTVGDEIYWREYFNTDLSPLSALIAHKDKA